MPNFILSFCGACAIHLQPKVNQEVSDHIPCDNCGFNVAERRNRLEGTFSEKDGQQMIAIRDGVVP